MFFIACFFDVKSGVPRRELAAGARNVISELSYLMPRALGILYICSLGRIPQQAAVPYFTLNDSRFAHFIVNKTFGFATLEK